MVKVQNGIGHESIEAFIDADGLNQANGGSNSGIFQNCECVEGGGKNWWIVIDVRNGDADAGRRPLVNRCYFF